MAVSHGVVARREEKGEVATGGSNAVVNVDEIEVLRLEARLLRRVKPGAARKPGVAVIPFAVSSAA